MIATTIQDIVFASRVLRRQWVPALTAALCIAAGIGATTTMFSIADWLLLRPLPYPNGDRLVSVGSTREGDHHSGAVSWLDYVDWTQRQRSFSALAAVGQVDFTVLRSEAERVPGALATANLFAALGVTPEAGRLFSADEDRPGGAPVILVSHGFAERQFGSVRQALGSHVIVDGNRRDIVGVIPDEGRYPSRAELWVPLGRDPLDRRDKRGQRNLDVIGAVRPDVTLAAAQSDMRDIAARLAREYPAEDGPYTTWVVPLRDRIVGDATRSLAALTIAALLVLLVACANVAALQLSRAAARTREIAVRTAIGAGRGRIVRQLLTESLLLALVGGVAGFLLAWWSTSFVSRAVILGRPAWLTFDIDRRALFFSLGAAVLTGVAFGIAPALRLARLRPAATLRGGDVGAASNRVQRALVVVEIALAVSLSAGAVIALQSVREVQRISLGFDPTGVLTVKVSMQWAPYDNPDQRALFVDNVENRLRALRDVAAAGAVTLPPVDGCCSQYGARIEGDASEHDARAKPMITGTIVTPGYFRTMGIALLAGRGFTSADTKHSPLVTIVNETFARKYWPRGDALGKHVDTGLGFAEIVGLVRDVKQTSLLDTPEPQFYRVFASYPTTYVSFAVRARNGDAAAVAGEVRRTIHSVDPGIPVYNVRTMQTVVDNARAASATFGELLAAFAMVALLLAAAGVYAITSFFVAERGRELGLRAALGAGQWRLVELVVRQSAWLAVIGLAVGSALALESSVWLASVLYGAKPLQFLPLVGAALALLSVTVLATFGPARRASAGDPMVALRAE